MLLYDLAAADGRRFSPFCWRIKMALAHKGLAFETVATPFTAIADIPGGGHRTVPVLDDGGRQVRDSFAIALYLEETYPDRPSLFGGPAGLAAARFVDAWTLSVMARISRVILLDIHDTLAEPDRAYFRASREKRFGTTLEAFVADRDAHVAALRDALLPLRLMLRSQPFVCGDAPAFGDHMAFGMLQWPRVASPVAILADDDPVRAWFERCLDLYGGLGRAEPAAAGRA